jgi:hypothetical protein
MDRDEIAQLPISSIVDGWLIDNRNTLYLWVKVPNEDGGVVYTSIRIPCQAEIWGGAKT